MKSHTTILKNSLDESYNIKNALLVSIAIDLLGFKLQGEQRIYSQLKTLNEVITKETSW